MLRLGRSNSISRRAWWRDMKKSDIERVNEITEKAKEKKIALRIMAGECPRAAVFSENRGMLDTRLADRERKAMLEEHGRYHGSSGQYTDQEEYSGQRSAYKSCSNIMDYIGRLEQVNLLAVLRYGLMEQWLTFPVAHEEGFVYTGEATCFDFRIDKVTPFLGKDMKVVLDVGITADIFYMLESTDIRSQTVVLIQEPFHTRETQHSYNVRVAFKHEDGSLMLKRITGADECAPPVDGWPLDQLLVPVVKPEETEEFCEFITAYLLKEEYTKDIPRSFRTYHAGMSLPAEHRITKDESVLAKIFFYEGMATCYDGGEAKEVPVWPGSVWIDGEAIKRRAGKWHRQSQGKHVGEQILRKKATFHEGFHWYTAAPHFCLLRRMSELNGTPAMCYSLSYDVRKENRWSKSKQAQSPVAYFESLDDRCEPRIVMPRKAVCSRVEMLKEEQMAARRSRISWTQIIDTLADEFLTSKEATKYRLIELGYTDAQGARNWISFGAGKGFYCAEYVPPADMDRQRTYEVSRAEGLREYKSNAAFRQLLRDLPFAYVDGHYVIDDPKYVTVTKYGARMSEYALTHMDECCIPFRKVAAKRIYSTANGFLCHEVLQKKGALTQSEVAESMKKAAEAIKLRNEIDTFIEAHRGMGLPVVLDKHINNCGLSAFQIAMRAGISNHALTRYREGKVVPDGFTLLKIMRKARTKWTRTILVLMSLPPIPPTSPPSPYLHPLRLRPF